MPKILPKDTDEKIMLEVVKQSVSKGLKSVSARTIATSLGVTDNVIFRHFGSVKELWASTYRLCISRGLNAYWQEVKAGKVHTLEDLYICLRDYYMKWSDAASFIIEAKPFVGISPVKLTERDKYNIAEIRRLLPNKELTDFEAGCLWEYIVIRAMAAVKRLTSGDFVNHSEAAEVMQNIVFGKYFY